MTRDRKYKFLYFKITGSGFCLESAGHAKKSILFQEASDLKIDFRSTPGITVIRNANFAYKWVAQFQNITKSHESYN